MPWTLDNADHLTRIIQIKHNNSTKKSIQIVANIDGGYGDEYGDECVRCICSC